MEFVTALALVSIAILLFYRFVERRHKIAVGKVAVVLIIAVLVGVWANNEKEQRSKAEAYQSQVAREQRKRSVAITYLGDSLKPTKATTRHVLSFRLCNQGMDTLWAVVFTPLTVLRGRSTEYPVIRPVDAWLSTPQYRQSEAVTTLRSDYILPPTACKIGTWEGDYDVKDSVYVRVEKISSGFWHVLD